MTPRAQELLDLLRARAAERAPEQVSPCVRERVIVEKFDHEQGDEPVLVETVEMVLLDGVLVDHTVTPHAPPGAGE